MYSSRTLLHLFLPGVVATLIGCGPKTVLNLDGDASLPLSVAVLPADYSVDIPRERVDITRNALINSLRNRNFVVVEDKVVNSLCSSADCPERAILKDQYLIDGFVSLKLSSVSQNNFIAGYYDSLSGEMFFFDREGRELVHVKHTERARGGLLFESGQILQGLISQVKRSNNSGFDNLAEKFAARLVGELPVASAAQKTPPQEGTEVALTSTSATWNSPSSYRVCAQGTPHSFAFLLLGPTRSSLRETAPGSYCGAFSALASSPNGAAAVELRTAFGNSVRRNIVIPVEPPCSLQNRLTVERKDGSTAVSILCARVGQDRSNEQLGCSDQVPQCSASQIVLFSGNSEQGPFKRIGELKKGKGSLKIESGSVKAVAVGSGGITSQASDIPATTPS